MTVRTINVPVFLVFLLLQISCSTMTGKKNNLANQINEKTEIPIATTSREEVSQKLAILIESAKKSGPEAVNFLADDIYFKASAAALREDHQTASLLLEHLTKLVPTDQYIKSKYAIELIREGNTAQSKVLLEEIYRDSKWKDDRIGLILAGVYISMSEMTLAQKTYKKVMSNSPKNQDACLFLAKSFTIQKNYKQALSTVNNCQKIDQKAAVFPYYEGKIYLAEGKLDKAKSSFIKSIKLDPDYFQSVIALGIIHEEQNQLESAIDIYQKYLERNPNDRSILSRIIQSYFSSEKFKEVIPYAERLIALEPDNLNMKVKLGILYTDIQQFDLAIKLFQEILKIVPESDRILYYLGAINQETNNLEQAIEYFTQIKPSSVLYHDSILQTAQILSTMALVYKSEHKSDAKAVLFSDYIDSKMIEKDNPIVDLSMIKANYFESIADNDTAIKILEAVQNNKEFNDGHRYYLASLYEKEQLFEDSTKIVQKILETDPKNAHAWNFLGYSLLERDIELTKAFEYINKALTLAPNDGYIRDSLGWYYYKTGQYTKALQQLKKARKGVNNDVTISKHLAIVYRALENHEHAKKYFTEALSNAQNELERKDIHQHLNHLEQIRKPASKDEK